MTHSVLIPEASNDSVPLIDTNTYVLGGDKNAPLNIQAQALLNRLEYHITIGGHPDLVSEAELISVATGEGASMVGIEDAGTFFTGVTVESALQEIGSNYALKSTLASVLALEGASTVGVEDDAGYYVATTVEAVFAEIGSKLAGVYTIVNDAGAARNLSSADASNVLSPTLIRFTFAGVVDVNVPANSGDPIPVGSQINMRDVAATTLTIVPAGGVTVNVPFGGSLVSAGAGSNLILVKVGTDEWDLSGATA